LTTRNGGKKLSQENTRIIMRRCTQIDREKMDEHEKY